MMIRVTVRRGAVVHLDFETLAGGDVLTKRDGCTEAAQAGSDNDNIHLLLLHNSRSNIQSKMNLRN